MVANSTFLWPYNWPLDWPIWCNLLTEGVVSYEELGNAKKALSKKCASSVHPKNATDESQKVFIMKVTFFSCTTHVDCSSIFRMDRIRTLFG